MYPLDDSPLSLLALFGMPRHNYGFGADYKRLENIEQKKQKAKAAKQKHKAAKKKNIGGQHRKGGK